MPSASDSDAPDGGPRPPADDDVARPRSEPPQPRRDAGRPRRLTIDDVAARAGVSSAAVSFAMNNRPGVAVETRARILAAAEELGWRPSAHARALTEARARAIGLLLARPIAQLEVDPFFVRFLAGVERALARTDNALVLRVMDTSEPVDLGAYTRLAASRRVDGFLLCDVELDDPRFDLLAAAGLPVVVAGHPVSPCPFPFVETEHARGVAAAVEYLVGLGHRHVGFVGGFSGYEFVQARLNVFRSTLADAGLEPGPVAYADAADPSGAAATARLLEQRPTAIVYGSDVLAAAGLGVAREHGLDVPGDLSITGFDDSPLAALAGPPVTSVRIDYTHFGEVAAATLIAMIAGEEPPTFIPAPPELVVRASTAPVRP